MPSSQARVAENVEDGFNEFCLRLISSISILVAPRRRVISDVMNKCMAQLREILVALEVELTDTAPRVADSTTANQ